MTYEETEQTLRAILIAGVSGLINYLYLLMKGDREFSFLMLFGNLAVSGWMGWITGISLDAGFHLGFLPRDAIIGMAGLTSFPIMELLQKKGGLIVRMLFSPPK